MIFRINSLIAILLLMSLTVGSVVGEGGGIRAPANFEVIEFAGSDLANDIYCMTIDPKGRIVVSARGYIKILVDDDGDGRADRALAFADGPPDGAMGLLWEGDTLYATGGGGLIRYRDLDGDDRADGPPELIWALKTGGEHHAHALRRGPDGWLYLIAGNITGIDETYATLPTTPIEKPEAGCVLRFSPDGEHSEIVAEGFRNPYDFDFNAEGELFAFDSDNERCVSLPWYAFTRFSHVKPGGHHGWLSPDRGEFWRYPPEYEDVSMPVADLGRGSPTGVVCYRLESFPEPYQGGFFLLDWTFGKVHFVRPERSGATYRGDPEIFLQAVGNEGFAPTDVVVHPDSGDLYVSIGGRGTRGAVYRVRYVGESSSDVQAQAIEPKLHVPPGAIDRAQARALNLPAAAERTDALDRLRALLALKRHREEFPFQEIERAIRANWNHTDRPVRQAVAALISTLDPPAWRSLSEQARTPWSKITFGFGVVQADPARALEQAILIFQDSETTSEQRLAAVRLIQLASGGLVNPGARGTVWEGYSARLEVPPTPLDEPLKIVRSAFPSGDPTLDRELSRTLAMWQVDDPSAVEAVACRLGESADPVEEIHDLIVLARLQGLRSPEVTERSALALLGLDRKLDAIAANRDRHWPLRISELYEGLADRDHALHAEMLLHPEFGRPDHALFARSPGFDRRSAGKRFLDRAETEPDFAWNPAVIEIVGELEDDRALVWLRELWGRAGLDDLILPVLARSPTTEDRQKFFEGLRSSRPATLRASLKALELLDPPDSGEEVLALLFAWRRVSQGDEGESHRLRIVEHLRRTSGRSDLGTEFGPWSDWFAEAYPDHAQLLAGGDGVDINAWADRLAGIDWSTGDFDRGQQVFTRTQCAACHSGNQAIGPDLRGVTGRFSTEDLFNSILQPSRDVAERYRTQLIATVDGNLYQGIIIYEAVDGLLLQTGAAETVRIAGETIEERRESETSLMPSGLIDDLTDGEIADLYEYLKGLH